MKKITALFIVVLLALPIFSQITIEDTGGKENIIRKCQWCSVVKNNDGYILMVFDRNTNIPIEIKLGDEEEVAKQSLRDLLQWFENAEKKDYATIKDKNGNDVTIYKGINWTISTGNGEFVRKEMNQIATSAWLGANFQKRRGVETDKTLLGFITQTFITNTLLYWDE